MDWGEIRDFAKSSYRQTSLSSEELFNIVLGIIVVFIAGGFTLFVIFIEGGTTPLGAPFVILVTLFGLIYGRKRFSQQPLLLFFFVACLAATLFFAGWGIYWHGLPEFSEVGIID